MVALVVSCLVIRLVNHPHTSGLPYCLRRPLVRLASILYLSDYNNLVDGFQRSLPHALKSEDLELGGTGGGGLVGGIRQEATVRNEWVFLAAVIDRLCLILYVFLCVVNFIRFHATIWQPVTVIWQPVTVIWQPVTVMRKHVTVIWQPVTVIWQPVTVIWQPVTVMRKPVTVIWQPVTVIWQPVTVMRKPVTVIWQPMTVIWQPMTVIWQPVTVIWQLESYNIFYNIFCENTK
ncbi:hypothetical protein Hamer_G020812, partial [Homarus americanus]